MGMKGSRKRTRPKRPPICKKKNCDRKHFGLGLCQYHYNRKRTGAIRINGIHITCVVEGCDMPHKAKGLCKRHYMRQYMREYRAARKH